MWFGSKAGFSRPKWWRTVEVNRWMKDAARMQAG